VNYTQLASYPVPTDPSWNVTDTSKLIRFSDECPRSFFYEYLLGWRSERPSIHTHFGEALHEALEFLLLNGYTVENTNKAHEIFLSKFREVFAPEADETFSPKNPARARDALVDYVGTYLDDLEHYEVLHTEIGGSVSISERFKVTFRMDAILRERANGLINVLDHKTGTMLNQHWIDKWQLSKQIGTYLHAAHGRWGKDNVRGMTINGLFFKKVKDDSKAEKHMFKRVDCTRTSDQMRVWLSTMNRICESLTHEFELLASESPANNVMRSFPLRDGACFNFNKKCPFHDFCTFWPNPLAHANEVPLGFKQEFWNPLAHVKLNVGMLGS
jgi:hypothetical protein